MIVAHKGVAHPWLCDVMGHKTARYYVAMIDDASYHFLNAVFGWEASADAPGWADVRHVIEYQDEVGAGDLLEVSGQLIKIGGKSITVHYHMHNLTRNNLAATLESTSVYFDLKARKALTIPDALREKAAPYLDAAE